MTRLQQELEKCRGALGTAIDWMLNQTVNELHGCLDGDCPHDNYLDCIEFLLSGYVEDDGGKAFKQITALVEENTRLHLSVIDHENDCACLPEDQSVTETVTALRREIERAATVNVARAKFDEQEGE